jgi:hypothetical protein
MEYAQCLLGGLIGEGLITLEKLVEAVFSDQGSRKAFLCQFLCPFLDELYCTRPALLVGDRFKVCVFVFVFFCFIKNDRTLVMQNPGLLLDLLFGTKFRFLFCLRVWKK